MKKKGVSHDYILKLRLGRNHVRLILRNTPNILCVMSWRIHMYNILDVLLQSDHS